MTSPPLPDAGPLPSEAPSAPSPKRRHLVVTGTGRSGTTMMVQLLTRLGLDTGADRNTYHPEARAGLEWDIRNPTAPYVVKNPKLAGELPGLLDDGTVRSEDIDHVIVMLRDLDQAAASRVEQARSRGYLRSPGGLSGVTWPGRQRDELARRIFVLLNSLAARDIAFTVVAFPRIVEDREYAWRRIGPLVDADQAAFRAAFDAVADTSLVHRYDSGPPSLWDNLTILARDLRHRAVRKVRLMRGS